VEQRFTTEQLAQAVICHLQLCGPMDLAELAHSLNASKKEASAVLDVLLTTPLVSKVKRVKEPLQPLEGEAADAMTSVGDTNSTAAAASTDPAAAPKEVVYMYRSGAPLPEAVHLADLTRQISSEQRLVATCAERIACIKAELRKPASERSDPRALLRQLVLADSTLHADPLYSALWRRLHLDKDLAGPLAEDALMTIRKLDPGPLPRPRSGSTSKGSNSRASTPRSRVGSRPTTPRSKSAL
jgi:hypothetical protein